MRWLKVGRHVTALRKQKYIVTRETQHRWLSVKVADFYGWAASSGALNDGTVTSHTRKTVLRVATELLDAFPDEVVS